MLQNSSRKCFRPIFAIETELRVPFQRQLTCCLCYSYFSCLITVSLFLCFLKIITEACSRASIEDRLRSPNGLGLKWPLLCRKAVSGSFPPGIPPSPICLQVWCSNKTLLTRTGCRLQFANPSLKGSVSSLPYRCLFSHLSLPALVRSPHYDFMDEEFCDLRVVQRHQMFNRPCLHYF